jgi:regulator of sirC expression with transglutaminase-like and TPR domain
VYLEIARRINFPMIEVGMPGHFLIRPVLPDMEIFVDPFYQGEILFREDCQARLERLYGQPVELRSTFLEPTGARRFLVRILGNLKAIYLNQEDLAKALGVIERILLLFPDAVMELRDRGLLYYQAQRWIESRQDLETYLKQVPQAPDRQLIEQFLDRIQQELT